VADVVCVNKSLYCVTGFQFMTITSNQGGLDEADGILGLSKYGDAPDYQKYVY